MPPRTTQKSHRPRASDRTLVGTTSHPDGLPRLRKTPSSPALAGKKGMPGACLQTRACSRLGAGCQEKRTLPASGENFFLDIPFHRTLSTLAKQTIGRVRRRTSTKQRSITFVAQLLPQMPRKSEVGLNRFASCSLRLAQCKGEQLPHFILVSSPGLSRNGPSHDSPKSMQFASSEELPSLLPSFTGNTLFPPCGTGTPS